MLPAELYLFLPELSSTNGTLQVGIKKVRPPFHQPGTGWPLLDMVLGLLSWGGWPIRWRAFGSITGGGRLSSQP